MKKLYILTFLLVASIAAKAQSNIFDPSFGEDGIVTTTISGSYNLATATVVQPDGKILVAGHAGEPSTYKATVARYNSDGSLDTAFGNEGTLVIPVGHVKSFSKDIAVQEDGKIVVGAYTWNNEYGEFAAIRLNEDGSFDTSFGNQGIVIIETSSSDVAEALSIQQDGKIVLAGYSNDHFAVLRLNTDGSIDTDFGVNGWAITQFESALSFIMDIEIQEDGKIVQAGFLLNSYEPIEMAASRLNTDGTIDTAFGTNGKVRFNIGEGNDFVSSVALQNDGKIILGGHSWISNEELRHDFALVRLNSDGSQDTSYGDNGVATAQIVDGANYTSSIVIQEDQKVVLSGSTVKLQDYRLGLVRFDTDGSLDETFGGDGTGMVSPNLNGQDSFGEGLALQEDGKIIMVGRTYPTFGTSAMVVMRFDNSILGVTDNFLSEVRLYPNPASEYIMLQLNESSSSLNVEIVDILGKRVYASEVSQNERLDVSNLVQGTYFVKLSLSGKSEVIRFIKK